MLRKTDNIFKTFIGAYMQLPGSLKRIIYKVFQEIVILVWKKMWKKINFTLIEYFPVVVCNISEACIFIYTIKYKNLRNVQNSKHLFIHLMLWCSYTIKIQNIK